MRKSGFTLVEMITVMTVVSIAAAVVAAPPKATAQPPIPQKNSATRNGDASAVIYLSNARCPLCPNMTSNVSL